MRKLNIKKMCTSIALGFYIRNEEEYEEFKFKIMALDKIEDSIVSVYREEAYLNI